MGLNRYLFETLLSLGSFIAFSVRETSDSEKTYYWRDKTCPESIGPFCSFMETMDNYVGVKKSQKTLQRSGLVQELQRKGDLNGRHK